MKVIILHDYNFHWEIIESIMYYFPRIIEENCEFSIRDKHHNKNFEKYIKSVYPDVNFLNSLNNLKEDYIFINDTIYPKNGVNINKNGKYYKYYYICHELTAEYNNKPNVFYLCPFSKNTYFIPNILPYSSEKVDSEIPIFIVQGNFHNYRRNYKDLQLILEECNNLNFKIKLVGRGIVPNELLKYKEKLIIKTNLEFIEYHKEFLDCCGILPLVDPIKTPQYFSKKLTSNVSYGLGYNLKFFCHQKLAQIYNLDAICYNSTEDIVENFKNFLMNFNK